MNGRSERLWTAAAAVAAAALVPGAVAQEPPSADQVLARVAEVYASCRSYSDTGVVTDRYPGLLGHTVTKRFRTAFVRPDRFRFEFTESKGLARGEYVYVVWRNGPDVRTWWDVKPGIEPAQSLGLALGAATGVSGGSAHRIPALLLAQEVGGRCPTSVAHAHLLEDAAVGSAVCYRISGTYADWPVTLWVEKGTYLMRRVDLRTEIPDGTVESTTTYDPVLNGPVSAAMLAFDPPAK